MIRFSPVVMEYNAVQHDATEYDEANISRNIYVKFVTARMKKSQKLIMERNGSERQFISAVIYNKSVH